MNLEAPRWVQFTLKLVPAVAMYNGWVYSWGRSKKRNTDVGGKDNSEHIVFCGVDVGFYSEARRDASYKECYRRGLHGYKKGPWKDDETGEQVWGYHMQDKAGTPPGG